MNAQNVVTRFFARLEERDVDAFLELWAANPTMTVPFAPDGVPREIKGRERLERFWRAVITDMPRIGFSDIRIDRMSDPEWWLTRQKGDIVLSDGTPYKNQYICLFKVSGDRIEEYIEHFDSHVVVQSFGGVDRLAEKFGGLL